MKQTAVRKMRTLFELNQMCGGKLSKKDIEKIKACAERNETNEIYEDIVLHGVEMQPFIACDEEDDSFHELMAWA